MSLYFDVVVRKINDTDVKCVKYFTSDEVVVKSVPASEQREFLTSLFSKYEFIFSNNVNARLKVFNVDMSKKTLIETKKYCLQDLIDFANKYNLLGGIKDIFLANTVVINAFYGCRMDDFTTRLMNFVSDEVTKTKEDGSIVLKSGRYIGTYTDYLLDLDNLIIVDLVDNYIIGEQISEFIYKNSGIKLNGLSTTDNKPIFITYSNYVELNYLIENLEDSLLKKFEVNEITLFCDIKCIRSCFSKCSTSALNHTKCHLICDTDEIIIEKNNDKNGAISKYLAPAVIIFVKTAQ